MDSVSAFFLIILFCGSRGIHFPCSTLVLPLFLLTKYMIIVISSLNLETNPSWSCILVFFSNNICSSHMTKNTHIIVKSVHMQLKWTTSHSVVFRATRLCEGFSFSLENGPGTPVVWQSLQLCFLVMTGMQNKICGNAGKKSVQAWYSACFQECIGFVSVGKLSGQVSTYIPATYELFDKNLAEGKFFYWQSKNSVYLLLG